jgi:hypothetical protein
MTIRMIVPATTPVRYWPPVSEHCSDILAQIRRELRAEKLAPSLERKRAA